MSNNEKVFEYIKSTAKKFENQLRKQMNKRTKEMESDDNSHYLIYEVLGIKKEEGNKIDYYQNMGRFLYKYAGAFLELITLYCFQNKYPSAIKTRLPNTLGSRPKTFEIDCLVKNRAYEIKWRDATTDGDHITKEHTRVKVIQQHGYTPVRIMFYYPNRSQAIKIQETLKTLYLGVSGEYYCGDEAWDYIKKETGIDLKEMLISIARR